jgi:hypothetical protein
VKAHHRDGKSMKRFYDWFYRFYGLIERNVGPTLAMALERLDPEGSRYAEDEIFEWACGSGELGIRLIPRTKGYEGRDLSDGMLARARRRWERCLGAGKPAVASAPFSPGDMTRGFDTERQWDWVFMSFALHLFDAPTRRRILSQSLSHAKKGVVVIDHAQRRQPLVALVEWIEGSHYEEYVKIDFELLARELGCGFVAHEAADFALMEFLKREDAG